MIEMFWLGFAGGLVVGGCLAITIMSVLLSSSHEKYYLHRKGDTHEY